LGVTVTQSSDTQVTHIRLYRTVTNGATYFLDSEITANITVAYGYSEGFEETDAYIAGTGYKYSIEDTTNGTENTYTWEELYSDRDDDDSGRSSGSGGTNGPDKDPDLIGGGR